MSSIGSRYRPTLDGLESRQVLSAALAGSLADLATSHSVAEVSGTATTHLSARPLSADPQFTLDQLAAFSRAYLTTSHDALYNPAFDFNQNGFIGQGDGKVLLHQLPPISPKVPLKVRLTLAPQDQARGHVSSNSGGHTYHRQVTILGHTTPGSLIFSDSSAGDYTFTGPVTFADARGNFSFKVTNTQGINNNDFLVIDPYGQQTILDDPIFWIPFAAKGSTLK